jgi:hypothetical protein
VPFVQGQLRGETLSFIIETECGHCHEPLQIEIDSDLKYRVVGTDAEPLVYVPMVDVHELDEPSIIDGF